MKFFKVTDQKVCEAMADYFALEKAAFDAMVKFSRKHGGHRKHLGMSRGPFGTSASIMFAKEPDRNVWKMTRDRSGDYWVPKATKAAKEVSEEFIKLNKAFPSKWDVYKLLKYDPFGYGFASFGKYSGVWVIGMSDEFRPTKKQSGQLERISDLEYETLLAGERSADT